MKVIFIINSLKERSGIERVACLLANLFTNKLNLDVSIINRDSNFSQSAYELDKSITLKALNGNLLTFSCKLRNSIEANNPDVIITHNMGKLSLLSSLVLPKRCRVISLEHISFASKPTWVKYFSAILYKKINNVICLTKHDKNYYSWHNDARVINNISPYSNKNVDFSVKSEKLIIAMGRLTYQKNFSALIYAWSKIEDKYPDWKLEIWGDGEEKHNLQELIKEFNLNNIFLRGGTNSPEEIYKKASFLVMSSRYEGLPMVLIEAQTFGLPIVSFDCPYGPSEIIENGVDGLLVENQNIEKLSEAIELLIENKDLRVNFSKQALNRSSRFEEKLVLEEWKKLLSE